MKLSAPWIKHCRELEALFADDPEVKIAYDDDAKTVKLYVDNPAKADALAKIIAPEKQFGNVTLKIEVVPSDKEATMEDLFNAAFLGNPALSYTIGVDTPMGRFEYALFDAKVVQFWNDDISDANGICSTLYEDIARDVFNEGMINFCTEPVRKELAKPLGEWP